MKKHAQISNAEHYRNMPKEKRRLRDRQHYLRSLGVEIKKAKPVEESSKTIIHPINLQRLSGDRFVKAVNRILRG